MAASSWQMARSSARYLRERTRTTHSFQAESAASLHPLYSSCFTPIHYRLSLVALLIATRLAACIEISSERCCQRCQCLIKIALILHRGLGYGCLYLVWRRSLCHWPGWGGKHSSDP